MRKHPRLFLGLLAGLVAITANTLVLKAAPLLAINAESGGLLRLVLVHATPVLPAGLLPVVKSEGFKLLFHYLTGLGMVGLYVLVFEPRLPGNGWVKGGLFSLLPWAINGFVVLPLLGQGVAGVHALTAGGMAYFFLPTRCSGWCWAGCMRTCASGRRRQGSSSAGFRKRLPVKFPLFTARIFVLPHS